MCQDAGPLNSNSAAASSAVETSGTFPSCTVPWASLESAEEVEVYELYNLGFADSTVFGHGRKPGPPTMDSVMAGVGSLTVAWNAPSQTSGMMVTAYDLRYIRTVVNNVWTAAAGGLEHVITALVGGAQYDVQVRAVSGASKSPWSTTVTATPERVTTRACATGGAVPIAADNPGLVSDCNALLAARDALARSATLNWSASTPIVDWDGVTVSGTPQRVTGLVLYNNQNNQLTGAIPTELGSLPKLQVLALWGNQLTGPIPASPTWNGYPSRRTS